jgi:hypothetical protein
MKLSKKITTLFLSAALVLGTSVTALADSNEDVIKALKDAKMPETYIIQAENYLKTRELTAEEASAVKAQIVVADKVLDNSKVKDVTKLSTADTNKILAAVKEAGKAVGLTINVSKQSNGKLEVVAKDKTGKAVVAFASNQVKQTGFNDAVIYAGAFLIVLAAGSVYVLRKSSVSNT